MARRDPNGRRAGVASAAALTPDRLGAWLFWLASQFPQSIYVVPLACGLAFAFVVDRLTFRLAD